MPQAVLSSTSISKRIDVPARFFVGIVAALIVFLALHLAMVYWQLGVPTRSSQWSYEINQKKLQRAASIREPKLLFVGGSATLFGIQAELLQARLDYPTVNFGIHAGLGVYYITHLAKKAAKRGDTVVLAFEYGVLRRGLVRLDPIYIDYLVARDPAYFRALPPGNQFEIAMSMTWDRWRKGIRNRLRPERPGPFPQPYDPANLSAHGDQLGHDAAHRRRRLPRFYVPDPVLSNGFTNMPPAFQAIEEFVRWANTNGVRVLATYPNIMDHPAYHTDVARKTVRDIRERYQELRVPFIGNLEESMMPPSAFYDTLYHLTSEGARTRTEQLIGHLAPYLSPEANRARK